MEVPRLDLQTSAYIIELGNGLSMDTFIESNISTLT